MDNASCLIATNTTVDSFELDVDNIRVTQQFLDEARDIERDMVDRIGAAKLNLDRCDRRAEQVEMAVKSDLFVEFPAEPVYRVQELRDSVRVKHKLLSGVLDKAHRLADECDEKLTMHAAAEYLDDAEAEQRSKARLKELVLELQNLHRQCKVVCSLLYDQSTDQATIFSRLRR